jgi:hypothetical protein
MGTPLHRRTSLWALLLLVVGIGSLVVAVLHPAVAVIEAASPAAVAGNASAGESASLLPGPIAVESGGLLLVSVAATLIGTALALARLA